ncbi:hypothetical protein OUZ56_002943 [Daphnia magna]|uniref:GNAT family N-acetyltransferase n=1 Tax=Daphnia magna TaxID=35525 RepID=A0ABR0A7Q4_9CRUS|nr:hypothetical protein OUZ56_002943 [Daphnia magna]
MTKPNSKQQYRFILHGHDAHSSQEKVAPASFSAIKICANEKPFWGNGYSKEYIKSASTRILGSFDMSEFSKFIDGDVIKFYHSAWA